MYRNESNLLHREDGPAIQTEDLIQWFINGKLHRPNGPAVMTPTGTKFYYWKGIFIEPSLWAKRDTITVEEIFALRNVELRRSMIELVGFEEILRRVQKASTKKACLLEKDEHGYELYKVDMPEDDKEEPLVVIKLIDSTELKDPEGRPFHKNYYLRIPPKIKTCAEAIAWTFNMKNGEYVPESEA